MLKLTALNSLARNFWKANRASVIDVLLYGSTVRGKTTPRDIDLLVLFADRTDDRLAHAFEKELKKKGFSAEVQARSWAELFETGFLAREAILSDAVSLINGKFLHALFGYASYVLFRYSLKGFTKTRRVRFHYALRGRGTTAAGFLSKVKGTKLADSSVLVPVKQADEFASFLQDWQADFTQASVLMTETSKQSLS